MVNRRCVTCEYFALSPNQDARGECRIRPPTVVPTGGDGVNMATCAWPNVSAEAWCAEYKEKMWVGKAVPE